MEQFRSAAGKGRREGLAQDDFVVIAAAHAFSHGFYAGHVLLRRVIADDGTVAGLSRARDRLGAALEAASRFFAARKIELEALDLLLLPVHEINVVAKEQTQILNVRPRQLLLDGVEAKQQVVSECAGQGQPRRKRMMKLADECAEYRKNRRLFAPLFFREEPGQRLQRAAKRPAFIAKLIPMRMRSEHRLQQPIENFAASIQRAEGNIAVLRDDFQRRRNASDVPAGIPSWVLIT